MPQENKTAANDDRGISVPYFTAKPAVRWLSEREIVGGAYGEFFGGLFSKFADNRDRIDVLRDGLIHTWTPPPAPPTAQPEHRDMLHQEAVLKPPPWPDRSTAASWFDFVADVGDGFGPTYRVAETLAQPQLLTDPNNQEELELPVGQLLVFGGDEVYPVANRSAYRDRTVGPYALAFANHKPGRRPALAVPGNHDWYDGLSAFLDVFTVSSPERAHGSEQASIRPTDPWFREQTRSYFAAELGHDWWLWGVDMGLHPNDGVSEEQTAYFHDAAHLLRMRDQPQSVIVCVSEPTWIKRTRTAVDQEPDSWDQLVDFMTTVFHGDDMPPWDSAVRLILTGDKHYYAHHEAASHPDRLPRLVTAGGGGAYLSSTLDVPEEVTLNTRPVAANRNGSADRADSADGTRYRKASGERLGEWPSKRSAKLIGTSGLIQVPILNPALNAIFSVIYGLYAYLTLTGWRQPAFTTPQDLVTSLDNLSSTVDGDLARTALLGPVVTLGGVLFLLAVAAAIFLHAWAGGSRAGRLPGIAFGLLHGLLHGIALVASLVISARLAWNPTTDETSPAGITTVLLLGAVFIAIPLLWNGFVFRVWEWWQSLYFVPPAVVLLLVLAFGHRGSGGETGALLTVLGTAVIGAVLGTMAFTTALVFGQFLQIGLNELIVGLRHHGYKHFLRIKVDGDGATVHVVGLRRTVPRSITKHSTENGRPALAEVRWPGHRRIGFLRGWPAQSDPELVDRFTVAPAPKA